MIATIERHPENGEQSYIIRLEGRGRSAWFPCRDRVDAEYRVNYRLPELIEEFNRIWG